MPPLLLPKRLSAVAPPAARNAEVALGSRAEAQHERVPYEDDALPSTSSDTRGLIDEGPSNRNRTVRQRSSIEAGSEDEVHDDGGGAHPFQAAPGYRVRRSTADAEADNGGQNNGDLVYSMEDWKFQKVDTVPWAVILMIANGLVIVTVFLLPI